MNDLIEKLKDNEAHRIYADMSKEERECLGKECKAGRVQYLSNQMLWVEKSESVDNLLNNRIYRINPDYQPEMAASGILGECKGCQAREVIINLETEPVDLKIEIIDGWLGVRQTVSPSILSLPHNFNHLHCLPSLPNFEGFYLWDNDKVEVRPEWVARYFPKVYARFRIMKNPELSEKAGERRKMELSIRPMI